MEKKDSNLTQVKTISVFIYTKKNNKILFLLGKENNTPFVKTNVDMFCEFLGERMNEELIEQSVTRTIFEKTMNLIIEPDEIEKIVPNLPYIINNKKIIVGFKIDYEKYKNIPEYYNRVFQYLHLCTTSNTLNHSFIESCPVGFLDKSELKWFNYANIIKQEIFSLDFYENLNLLITKLI